MRLIPILLIHGFNGAPSNWTGPKDRMPEFLAEHGLDPAFVRVFQYGYYTYNGKPIYNALGDMREIAHQLDMTDSSDPDRMVSSVDLLSKESVARGGPSKVTLIAHSSGGLIARYYLSRKTPDQFGTQYRGNVARLICLGTPHSGVDIEDLLDPLPTNFLIYRLMVRLHFLFPPEYHEHAQSLRIKLRELRRAALGAWDETNAETPAFKQFHPGSEFLDQLNRPGAMPNDVAFFNVVGDIRAQIQVRTGKRTLFHAERGFGDMLVSRESAGIIPNAPSDMTAIPDINCLDVQAPPAIPRAKLDNDFEPPAPIHRWLRSHPASRRRILAILGVS